MWTKKRTLLLHATVFVEVLCCHVTHHVMVTVGTQSRNDCDPLTYDLVTHTHQLSLKRMLVSHSPGVPISTIYCHCTVVLLWQLWKIFCCLWNLFLEIRDRLYHQLTVKYHLRKYLYKNLQFLSFKCMMGWLDCDKNYFWKFSDSHLSSWLWVVVLIVKVNYRKPIEK